MIESLCKDFSGALVIIAKILFGHKFDLYNMSGNW